MKKLITMLICVAMVLVMFCSCAKKPQGSGDQVTIRFSCWETGIG